MKRSSTGFTLIEILLVVILIGILASIAVPRFTDSTNQARIAAARADIQTLSLSLDMYELAAGRFPDTSQGLKALVEKPSLPPEPLSWNGPYLKKREVPRDPWGNDYVYEYPGKHGTDYDLFSPGPDGIAGNNDDIANWNNSDDAG
jgi:general secretion pathway protein G